jgi:hypothetical protein
MMSQNGLFQPIKIKHMIMIHKDIMFGNIQVQSLLEFGNGTIAVMPAQLADPKSSVIMFKSESEPNPINKDMPEYAKGKTSDEIKPEVVMVFTNPESVDTLMWALKKIKRQLLKSAVK